MPRSNDSRPVLIRRHLLLTGFAGVVGLVGAMGSSDAWARTVGSGQVQTERRTPGAFDAIVAAGSIDLVVRQGAQEAIELSADDNVLPLIETVVEDSRHGRSLMIRLRRGVSLTTKTPIKATVDVVRLQALTSAGSGRIQVGELKTPTLRLSLSGSGDASLQALNTETLEVRIAGSGDVRATGTAGQVKVTIAGSGDVDLLPLAADDVTISIAGSGDAKVTANKSLSATIAGSGDVVYAGSATAIRTSVAGSGKVSKR